MHVSKHAVRIGRLEIARYYNGDRVLVILWFRNKRPWWRKGDGPNTVLVVRYGPTPYRVRAEQGRKRGANGRWGPK